MEVSIFLAKCFGLYLVITAILVLLRLDLMASVIEDFYRSRAVVLLSSIFTLILGILIIVSHNVWVLGWPLMITLLGYLTLLKGILHFLKPEINQKLARKMALGRGYAIVAVINLIIGSYLLIQGFQI